VRGLLSAAMGEPAPQAEPRQLVQRLREAPAAAEIHDG